MGCNASDKGGGGAASVVDERKDETRFKGVDSIELDTPNTPPLVLEAAEAAAEETAVSSASIIALHSSDVRTVEEMTSFKAITFGCDSLRRICISL